MRERQVILSPPWSSLASVNMREMPGIISLNFQTLKGGKVSPRQMSLIGSMTLSKMTYNEASFTIG